MTWLFHARSAEWTLSPSFKRCSRHSHGWISKLNFLILKGFKRQNSKVSHPIGLAVAFQRQEASLLQCRAWVKHWYNGPTGWCHARKFYFHTLKLLFESNMLWLQVSESICVWHFAVSEKRADDLQRGDSSDSKWSRGLMVLKRLCSSGLGTHSPILKRLRPIVDASTAAAGLSLRPGT